MSDAFPANVTLKYLRDLMSMARDARVTLWTLQQPGAVKHLTMKGYLTGRRKFAFAPAYNHPGKERAYAWLQSQMQVRLDCYCGELPIWALPSKPTQTNRDDDILLRVEVPKRRILFSFYELWCRLLRGNSWEYFAIDVADREQNRPNNLCPPVHVCEKSWERMFELELGLRADLLWHPFNLQASLSKIWSRDVSEISSVRLADR